MQLAPDHAGQVAPVTASEVHPRLEDEIEPPVKEEGKVDKDLLPAGPGEREVSENSIVPVPPLPEAPDAPEDEPSDEEVEEEKAEEEEEEKAEEESEEAPDSARVSLPSRVPSDGDKSTGTPAVQAEDPEDIRLDTDMESPDHNGLPERQERLYRVWPSENRFFCMGLAMTGGPGHSCTTSGCLRSGPCGEAQCLQPAADLCERNDTLDRPVCTSTSLANCSAWACILVPSLLFFWLALPYYWTRVHPLLPLIAIFFFVLATGCLLAACCSDPGILPRREIIVATGTARKIEKELGYNILGLPMTDMSTDSITRVRVPEELKRQGYRWCSTCKIVRPPRASHCPDCDNCVMRWDHHCPFVNNCVGQRNYIFFMGFTTSVCFLALVVIPMLLWFFIQEALIGSDDSDDSSQVDLDGVLVAIAITVAAAGGVAGLFVLSLWVYHLFLIYNGITTKEHWKRRHSEDARQLPGLGEEQQQQQPSLLEELTIFGHRGPRLFNPRAFVTTVWGRGEAQNHGTWHIKGADDRVIDMPC